MKSPENPPIRHFAPDQPTTGIGPARGTHGAGVYQPQLVPWFAVRTRSRAEQAVANRLAAQDIPVFLPRYTDPVVWSDRERDVQRPLFPGYLFARLPFPEQVRAVTRTQGVVQILGANGPEPIDPAQIDSIRIACESGAHLEPCSYRTGEVVLIKSGPFAGCEAVVDRMKKGRLILRVDMLNRAVAVTIDPKTRIERKR